MGNPSLSPAQAVTGLKVLFEASKIACDAKPPTQLERPLNKSRKLLAIVNAWASENDGYSNTFTMQYK